jgi:hypothetical protein
MLNEIDAAGDGKTGTFVIYLPDDERPEYVFFVGGYETFPVHSFLGHRLILLPQMT